MHETKSQKEKQIQDINEVMVEIKEAYNKIQEKISYLKETNFKETVDKFAEDASSILDTINQAGQDLKNKSLKEIEAIKNKVLAQFDKASNLQHELKRIYTKEAFMRQYVSDELSMQEASASKFLDRSLNNDLDNTFSKSKHTPVHNYEGSPQIESFRYDSEGQRRYRPSFCTSDFSEQIIHEFYENSEDQDNCSFEDYKAYRNTMKNKRMSRHQVSQSVQLPRNLGNQDFKRETSDYEVILSKRNENRTENQSYIENIWNLHKTFGKIASPKKGEHRDNENNQPFFFKNSLELLQFLEQSDSEIKPRDYLWQYIFHLQDRLQTGAEYYERGLSSLREELAQKDEIIQQLMKKQEKQDLQAEAKYYDNLKLAYNSKKFISQLKNARYNNQDENMSATKDSMRKLKCITSKRDYDSSPVSAYGSVGSKKGYSTAEPYLKLPLNNISINQSYENPLERTFSGKMRNQQEILYSTAGSYATANTLQYEDDLVFSNNSNLKAYIQNLQETLSAMKENSVLVQSENNKLKEYVKLLRNKVTMLERENEQYLSKQNLNQSKSHRNYTQTSDNMAFKWTNPAKVLEMEQKNKAVLNSYRYNKSVSYMTQETEG